MMSNRRPPLLVKVQAHDGTPLGEGIYREDEYPPGINYAAFTASRPMPKIEMKDGSIQYGHSVWWEPIAELDPVELGLWDLGLKKPEQEQPPCPNCEKVKEVVERMRAHFGGVPQNPLGEDLKALFSLVG